MIYVPKRKAWQVSALEKLTGPVKSGFVVFQCKILWASPNNIHRSTTIYTDAVLTQGLEHICKTGLLQPAFCYYRILFYVTYSREQYLNHELHSNVYPNSFLVCLAPITAISSVSVLRTSHRHQALKITSAEIAKLLTTPFMFPHIYQPSN